MPEPQSEPVVEPKPQAEPVVVPEPQAEPVVEPEPQAEPVVEPEPQPEPVVEPEPEPEPEPELEPQVEPVVEPKLDPEHASSLVEPPLPEHPPPPLHEHESHDGDESTPIEVTGRSVPEAPAAIEFVDSEAIAEGIADPQDITCFPEELRKSYLGAFVAIALLSDHQLDSRMALCLQDSADSCGLSAQSMIEIRDVAFDDPASVRDFLRQCLVILSHSVLRYSVALDILSIVYASRAECRERRLPTTLEDEAEQSDHDECGSDEERSAKSEPTTSRSSTTEVEALRALFEALAITPEQQHALERYTEAFIQVIDAGDDNLLLEPTDDAPSAATFESLFASCSLPRNAVFRSGKTPLGLLLVPALDRVHAKLLAGEQQASGRASDDGGGDSDSNHDGDSGSEHHQSGDDGDGDDDDDREGHSDHEASEAQVDDAEDDDQQHDSGADSDRAKSANESDGSRSRSRSRSEGSGSDDGGGSEQQEHSGSEQDEQDADDDDVDEEDEGPGFTIDFIGEIQARKRAAINCTIS